MIRCETVELERKTKYTGHMKIGEWECFIRSGGVKKDGYIRKVKHLWNATGKEPRTTHSIVSQIKYIQTNVVCNGEGRN